MFSEQEVSVRLQKLYRSTPIAALLVASVLVVALAFQNRGLIERIQQLATRARDPYSGLYLPAISIATVTGDSAKLGECADCRAQLLFVFTTTCGFCRASLPAWKRIATAFNGDPDIEVYGISADSSEITHQFAIEHRLEFPVVSFTERRLRALYRSDAVPQTLILNPRGRVDFARLGALTDSAAVDSVIRIIHGIVTAGAWPR